MGEADPPLGGASQAITPGYEFFDAPELGRVFFASIARWALSEVGAKSTPH
ncbi:MAG: hypothetical protein M3020_16335 [Myxococcota bacterium]|nr:hypothetical protein [Myxococcota bacterium]